MTTTVTVDTFRKSFPEFGNTTLFPDTAVTYWLEQAVIMLNETRWQRMYDSGIQMFLAHNLVLEKQAWDAANVRGDPGINTGPVAAKGVGPATIAYSTMDACLPNADHWNLTIYGTRFLRMARYAGAGPLQIGIGCAPFGSGGAWAGPYPYPAPSGTGFSS